MHLDNMDFLDDEYCEAEYACEHDWERYDPVEEVYEFMKGIDTWQTANKKVLNISEMTTSHIKNCIKKIVQDEWRELCIWSLVKELIKRNEL